MPARYVCPSCLRAAQRSLPRTAASTLPQSPPARRWLSASPRLRREPPPPASSSPATAQNHAEGSNASSTAIASTSASSTPSHGEPPQPQPGHHNGNATAAAAANPAQQRERNKAADESEQGAMTRRLESLTEEGLLASPGRASSAIVEDAGFSEELRRKLEQRIAAASFKSDFAREIAVAELPASAGKGTRDVAGAAAWRGEESVGDAALRMLDDSVGRARGKAPGPSVRPPTRVDTGMRASAARGENRGVRLAGAREGASLYAAQKERGMSDEERERFRREMKERFAGPGARGGAMSVRALESLANERIEDAIARGQFRNIKRGGELERDYNASNPFLDTTEYFMNKIIQKQEIVPPWIEKQQELVTAATRFRTRLRADWKRHAARMIASKGGSLEVQMRRAQAYAEAERLSNPKARKEEKINAVDEDGHLSQITLAGELKVASAPGTKDNAEHFNETITVTAAPVGSTDGESASTSPQVASEEVVAEVTASTTQSSPLPHQQMPVPAALQPFRDPTWERTERSFLELSISSLNALTRSYNLMAPELAKKPYFALDRELASAYADVAPLLAVEIRDRALEPKVKVGPSQGHKVGGVLERFGTKQEVRVWDERGQKYGFKEFWRDLFAKE